MKEYKVSNDYVFWYIIFNNSSTPQSFKSTVSII